jgi:hypothetical protein
MHAVRCLTSRSRGTDDGLGIHREKREPPAVWRPDASEEADISVSRGRYLTQRSIRHVQYRDLVRGNAAVEPTPRVADLDLGSIASRRPPNRIDLIGAKEILGLKDTTLRERSMMRHEEVERQDRGASCVRYGGRAGLRLHVSRSMFGWNAVLASAIQSASKR